MRKALEILFTLLVGIAVGIAGYGSYTHHNKPIETVKTEYIYIEREPEVITETVYVEVEPEFYRSISDEDSFYYMDIAMREAENQGEVGMLWVMYTFQNRCETFGHTPKEEWESSAYETSMFRTGIEPNEDCLKAYEAFIEGWIPRPLYFRANRYHSFGTPLCEVGNHCFSTK